jgi:hypothetical protein
MWIAGGVLSHTFTGLAQLWGPFAFHAVCMVLAMACFVGPRKPSAVVERV